MPAQSQRANQVERAGRQACPADRAISLVREQEAVAKRTRPDAQERLQTRSRSPHQQGHQLRHRAIRARTPRGGQLLGLSVQLSMAQRIIAQDSRSVAVERRYQAWNNERWRPAY